jgi:hypothetical protein
MRKEQEDFSKLENIVVRLKYKKIGVQKRAVP